MIYPIIRPNLDILFVGLNPAKTSSEKGHYFSTDPAFWNQLYEAGLITERVDMEEADDIVFRSSKINYNNWEYGITDLVNYLAESKSRKVTPTKKHCEELEQTIIKYKPKVVVLLHSKVREHFVKGYLNKNITIKNGDFGKLISGCDTNFYNVPFPHGNEKYYSDERKIEHYKKIKELLIQLK